MRNQRGLMWSVYAGFLVATAANFVWAADLSAVQTAIMENAYERAENEAAAFIVANPKDAQRSEAEYFLGLSQLRLEKYDAARKTFSKLIKEEPAGGVLDKAYLGLFDAYYMDEYYKEALSTAKTLLKKRPHSEFLSLIYLKLARANLKLTNWQEAKKYLHLIVVEFTNSLEYHVARQLLEEEQYFAVQVGAFLEQVRAQNLAQQLNGQGEYAYIIETKSRDGQTFYRVRVGKLTGLKDAQALETKLSSLGYPTLIYP